MAEVGLLIIFVLLLLIGMWTYRFKRLNDRIAGSETISVSELSSLKASSDALKKLHEVVGGDNDSLPSEIERLVRALQDAKASPEGATALTNARSALKELQETREEMQRVLERVRGKDAAEVATAIQNQAFELETKEGQLQYAQKRLAALGSGSGERPCWVEPSGTVLFLFDVLLTSQGIRMRERAGVDAVRERFPIPKISSEKVLSQEEFLRVSRPLYDYGRSDERQCRFHVWIFDGTEGHEKVLYKRLIETVEGHFYRQYKVSDGSAF